jgi:predicted homoserine dehydrogenase-like protein
MTGDPVAGAYHAERASDAGLHVVMVNVEATFEARTGYARRCFGEYGVPTDPTGRYAALYRPCHLIGLEVGVSIASAVLRAEPTGTACGFHGDAVAVAKRDLEAGEVLDGEGGYMVYGKLAPAAASMRRRALPIGLARGVELCRDVPAGGLLSSADVRLDESLPAVRLRRELEASWLAAAGT